MKCRIFKKQDGGVIYSWPTKKYQEGSFDDCRFPESTKGLDFIDVEESEIIKTDSESGVFIEQLYFDGVCAIENLNLDSNWEKNLMPHWLIGKKHVDNKSTELDTELAKVSPDPMVALKIQREIELVKAMIKDNSVEIYELALANLDAKVSKGEEDKPEIRTKLEAKINELK